MNKNIVIALLAVTLLTVACQPATVIVRHGENVPEQKAVAPIYVTATPVMPMGIGEWTYEDAQKDGIVRFTDKVDGHLIVCYYPQRTGYLECLSLEACAEGDEE